MSLCELTEREFAAGATSTEVLLVGQWMKNFARWTGYHGGMKTTFFGMEHLTQEEEACLADPGKYRQELTDCTPVGPTPTVEERFDWRIEGATGS